MREILHQIARLKHFLRHRGRRDEDADDLIQEAFLRLEVYKRKHEVLEPEAFLVRTVANLSVDKYRRDGVLEVLERPVDELDIIDTTPQPEEVCELRQRVDRLMKALEAMSPKARDVLIGRRYEGLSAPEIAKRQGVSVSAVEKSLARAILQLTDSLNDDDIET